MNSRSSIKASRELNQFNNLLTNNTLGYMDAIVDKDSGDVDKSIIDKSEEFAKWMKTNELNFFTHAKFVDSQFDSEAFLNKYSTYTNAGSSMISDIKNKKINELGKYDDDIDGLNESMQVQVTNILKIAEERFKKASLEVTGAQQMISNSSLFSLY